MQLVLSVYIRKRFVKSMQELSSNIDYFVIFFNVSYWVSQVSKKNEFKDNDKEKEKVKWLVC
jgi:hypothetical protein